VKFYYGDLGNVDGLHSIEHGIAVLGGFDFVVGNEPSINTSPEAQAVQAAIASKLYGYANLGIAETEYNGCIPPVSATTAIIDRCAAAGYAGVFFDAAGQPGIPREQLNYFTDLVHQAGMNAFPNSHPDGALSTAVDTTVLPPPTVAPAVSAQAGSTALAAGTYTFAVTFTTYDGETPPGPTSQVTITAGQEIAMADYTVPSEGGLGVLNVNVYMSIAAGSPTLGLIQSAYGFAATFTALPPSGAPQPPTQNTAYAANPNGLAWPYQSTDWTLWESFYSESTGQYDGVGEGAFQYAMDYYLGAAAALQAAAAAGKPVGWCTLSYALPNTDLMSIADQAQSYILALMLGATAWSYGGSTSNDRASWPSRPNVVAGNSLSASLPAIIEVDQATSGLTYTRSTDEGVLWFKAMDSPVTRSAGVYATPTGGVDLGVPPVVPASAAFHSDAWQTSQDAQTWTSWPQGQAATARYARVTTSLASI
jgi:hypothetical protein